LTCSIGLEYSLRRWRASLNGNEAAPANANFRNPTTITENITGRNHSTKLNGYRL
jgi:hypothetical protein